MPPTVWLFHRRPSGEITAFPHARFQRLFDGEEKYEAPGSAQRFIEVVVEVEHRQAARVHSVNWFKMRVDPGGRFNKMWALRGAMDHLSASSYLEGKSALATALQGSYMSEGARHVDALLMEAIYEEEHKWHPTEEDLERLCEAVNRRAKRRLLSTDGKELFRL